MARVARSAPWWWGFLDVAPALVEVAVGREHQPRARDGARLVRTTADPVDRTRLRGLLVTPARRPSSTARSRSEA